MEFEARIDAVGSVEQADLFHFLKIVVDVSERGHEGGMSGPGVDASDAVGELAEQVIHDDGRSGRMVVPSSNVSTELASRLPSTCFSCNGRHL